MVLVDKMFYCLLCRAEVSVHHVTNHSAARMSRTVGVIDELHHARAVISRVRNDLLFLIYYIQAFTLEDEIKPLPAYVAMVEAKIMSGDFFPGLWICPLHIRNDKPALARIFVSGFQGIRKLISNALLQFD